MKYIEKLDATLTILVIIDILLILLSVLFNLSTRYVSFILLFDTILCIILIINFIMKMRRERNKKLFFNNNWLDLFASLPLGVLALPFLSSTLYAYPMIILIRVLRLILLLKLFSKFFKRFMESTYLDKIMAVFIVIILGSTLALYYFEPNVGDIFDALWYVFQTITTVGYGDIIPSSPIGKFVGLILLVAGVLMFSIFTASFSYLFTEKVFKQENDEFNQKMNFLKENLYNTKVSIDEIRENASLNNEDLELISKRLDKLEENTDNLSKRMDYIIEIIEKK